MTQDMSPITLAGEGKFACITVKVKSRKEGYSKVRIKLHITGKNLVHPTSEYASRVLIILQGKKRLYVSETIPDDNPKWKAIFLKPTELDWREEEASLLHFFVLERSHTTKQNMRLLFRRSLTLETLLSLPGCGEYEMRIPLLAEIADTKEKVISHVRLKIAPTLHIRRLIRFMPTNTKASLILTLTLSAYHAQMPPTQHQNTPISMICCYLEQHYSPTLWRSQWSSD
ncbi:hypothetical protein AAMO2058_001155000 [Amorphochlora amoebiformis]